MRVVRVLLGRTSTTITVEHRRWWAPLSWRRRTFMGSGVHWWELPDWKRPGALLEWRLKDIQDASLLGGAGWEVER